MNRGGAEREIQNPNPGSRLQAVSTEPVAGLELTDREIVTWAKSAAQPTEPPRRPSIHFLNQTVSNLTLNFYLPTSLLSKYFLFSSLQLYSWESSCPPNRSVSQFLWFCHHPLPPLSVSENPIIFAFKIYTGSDLCMSITFAAVTVFYHDLFYLSHCIPSWFFT